MPRRARTHMRTRFAEFVKKTRGDRTQGDFQVNVLRYGKAEDQYLSKVETGIIRFPNEAFLQRISDFAKTPLPELKRMCEEPAEGLASKVGIVFGHCLWAGPLVLAAWEHKLSGFRFASYGFKDDKWRLEWIDPSNSSQPRPGPKTVASSNRPPSLSAGDVVDLLVAGEAEFGVLPGDVLPEQDTRFERVASIADTWVGGCFVSDQSFKVPFQDNVSTSELACCLAQETVAFKVAAERGTAAEEYLQDVVRWINKVKQISPTERGGKSTIQNASPVKTLRMEDVLWDQPNKALATLTYAEIKAKCQGLAGVITWEPHASWLFQTLNVVGSRVKFPLHFRGSDRPKQLTFDLVRFRGGKPRSAAYLSSLYTELIQLIYHLDMYSKRLSLFNTLRLAEDSPEEFRRLSEYFRLAEDGPDAASPVQAVFDAVKGIRYRVIWDPVFVELHLTAKTPE